MNARESYIIFELADSSYGLRSDNVLHLEMVDHITPVPNAAPAVDGVVFSRGRMAPVINLRVRFGFPRLAPTPRTRLIFLETQARTVALLVDAAREFRVVTTDTVRPATDSLHGISGNYVRGHTTISGRLVLLLDVAAVLNLDDHLALAVAERAVLQAAS